MNRSALRNTSASYFQFQQSLDQYVYFSPLTMGGASGRAVKIHKDLFLPFFCIVDPATHDGQSIIRQIENLRTTCTIARKETGSGYANNPRQGEKHKTQLAKVDSAFHQVLIIKNLHVHYRVSQEAGDQAPSIYIMRIRQVSSDTGGSPGLYEQEILTGGRVRAKKLEKSKADGKTIYINGGTKSSQRAILDARYATNDNSSLLFYCPARTVDELGIAGTTIKSKATKETISELANIIQSNQKSPTGVSWYIEGEGANVLAEAIKQVQGELSSHNFRLINPIANTAKLIESLSGKKAKFEGEFFKYDQNKTALIAMGAQKDTLLQAIGKLPAGKNYDLLTRNYIIKSISDLSPSGEKAKNQSKANSLTTTFVQRLRAAGGYRK